MCAGVHITLLIVYPVPFINYVHNSLGSLPYEISHVSNVVSRSGQDLGCQMNCHILLLQLL